MMKLYIDTRNSEKVVVGLDKKRVERLSKKEKSQAVLQLIKELLEGCGKSIQDVKEIEVETGPGSFTGLRVGVSVANALGWSLGVPVNRKDIAKEGSVEPVYTQEGR